MMYDPFGGDWEMRPEPYRIRYAIAYTWRRWTWQFRKFPEVRGMGYNRYRKTYRRRAVRVR